MRLHTWLIALSIATLSAGSAMAAPFFFNTGDPDGRMATASQPGTAGKIEKESADDFILTTETVINHATFTGLLTGGATLANIGQVRVEIYRVFPLDSVNPPSGTVNTRTNSPSDNALTDRGTASGNLTFTTTTLAATFTAANSVVNGINKKPNQTTGGEGAVTGMEVKFDVNLTTPLDLAADHYFFIPQVQITTANGSFLWLSAPKPISGAGTTPFSPDLQAWIRDANLDPDWSRIGTDIVGGAAPPTFNSAFSLSGATVASVPLPSSVKLGAVGMLCVFGFLLRHGSRSHVEFRR